MLCILFWDAGGSEVDAGYLGCGWKVSRVNHGWKF